MDVEVLAKAPGEHLQVLAQQGVLLAQPGNIGFCRHLLPHQLEVGLGGDCRSHVPLHGIHHRPGLVVRDVDADEGIIQRVKVVHGVPQGVSWSGRSRERNGVPVPTTAPIPAGSSRNGAGS